MRNADPVLTAPLKNGIFLLFVLLLASAGALAAGAPKSDPQTARAKAAEAQLKELALQNSSRTASAQTPGVSLRLNREIQTASTIFFYDNMESVTSAWTTSSPFAGGDLFHLDTLKASSPLHAWWAGIPALGNYNTGAHVQCALVSPAIDLTAAAGPVALLFAEDFYTEKGWDFCMVDVSTDGGGSWTHLRGGYGEAPSGNSVGWRIETIDLSPFAGNTVNIRFLFDTGDEHYNTYPGWFIDDVVIFDHAGTIAGKTFFDVNNNGAKDIGERGVRDWPVTAEGPISLTLRTNERGRYVIPLPLGAYNVSEAALPGWSLTYPPTASWSIDLASPDTLVDSLHFGNFTQASFINGRVFHDIDHDGVFNNADTVLANWLVMLEDSSGTVNWDKSDSLGEYSLYVFAPGDYLVSEISKAGWVQTAPPGQVFMMNIPDLATVSNGNDFGNYFAPANNVISGKKFNDQNRNGVWDEGEPAVPGFTITLSSDHLGGTFKSVTDSTGAYQFTGLEAGVWYVGELQQSTWWRSVPESTYTVLVEDGANITNLNIGNYEIAPGSISGAKYNDLNGNGVRDSGETGLAGWRMELGGTASATAYTDGDGVYTFDGLYPGTYEISEVWRDGWRQTQPANLELHHVLLGPEQDTTGFDFGNFSDSTFAATFRTFTYDSLALAKDARGKRLPAKPVPDKVEFTAEFVNMYPARAQRLVVRFYVPILGDLVSSVPAIINYNDKRNRVELTFTEALDQYDTVRIFGYGRKAKPQLIPAWWWMFEDLTQSPVQFGSPLSKNLVRWPMPNAINLMQATAAGLKVGLGGPHSVVHRSYKEVLKSLADKFDRLHLGVPRCLDFLSGAVPKSMKREMKYLNPARHNNVLLGEAIALQVNIRASDMLRTPAGFGNLIYDEGTGPAMPLNNMSVRQIALALDAFMSSYKDSLASPACTMPTAWAGLEPDTLYDRLRKINAAFSGPIDTISFSTGLRLKGVRGPEESGMLRYDTSSAMRPGTYYYETMVSELPERLELFQNYPNPFNPTTTIEFYLPAASLVTLKVYNMLGQEVAAIYDRLEMEDGYEDAEFDAGQLGSGVYFYRLSAEPMPDAETGAKAPALVEMRKMLLVK